MLLATPKVYAVMMCWRNVQSHQPPYQIVSEHGYYISSSQIAFRGHLLVQKTLRAIIMFFHRTLCMGSWHWPWYFRRLINASLWYRFFVVVSTVSELVKKLLTSKYSRKTSILCFQRQWKSIIYKDWKLYRKEVRNTAKIQSVHKLNICMLVFY